jgi:hypothetical protein
MRTRTTLLSVLLAAAVVPATAGAAVAKEAPAVSHGQCTLDVTNSQKSCLFTLLPGVIWVDVGVDVDYGWATIDCPNSGYHETWGGSPGYGDYDEFVATADVCQMDVDARGSHVEASVYPGR